LQCGRLRAHSKVLFPAFLPIRTSMYEKFYGLREAAFNLTPDPAFLFLNKRCKDALDLVLYGIKRREGFAVIVGDVGTGKTTLCWALLERLARKDICTALIQNPILSEIDILKSILQDLGVRPEAAQALPDAGIAKDAPQEVFDTDWMRGMTKKQLLDRLNMFLATRAQENVFTVLIVDEAQNLSMDLLEQLRLLSNLETAKKKLLQIIFVGQLELDRKLQSHSLRQLNQRISIRFETKALSPEDTERYIRHRLAMAGGAPRLRFGVGAFKSIWRHSKGYPRLINLICDRALLAGYSERSGVITRKLVRRAALGLQGKEDNKSSLSLILPHGWMRRLVPFLITAFLLLTALLFAIAKTS
jgi:general secretion pathway protein A